MSITPDLLVFIIPLIILQYALAIVAAIHVIRHPHYKFGNRIMWLLITLFIGIIGPVVYFIFGRQEE